MELHNKKNGHTILIDRIDYDSKRVIYTEYEKIIYNQALEIVKSFVSYQKTKICNLDLTLIANASMSIEDNIKKQCFIDILTVLDDNQDWVISYNIQNWLFPERLTQIIILNELVLKSLTSLDALGNLSPLGELLTGERIKNFGFYIANSNDVVSVLYANQIDSEDLPIIIPYIGTSIWVETKLN